MADLALTDCTTAAKVLVCARGRANPPAGITVPFGRASRDGRGALTVGVAPGRWLLLATGPDSDLAVRTERLVGDGVSVVDVSHGHALCRVTGRATTALLSRLCPLDLRARSTPDGVAATSLLAGVVTGLVRDDRRGVPSTLLRYDRSYGAYLWEVLLDAGREFRIEVSEDAAGVGT